MTTLLPNAVRFYAAAVPLYPGDAGEDVVIRAWQAAHDRAKVLEVPEVPAELLRKADHLAVIKIFTGGVLAPHDGYLALKWDSLREVPADLKQTLTGLSLVYEGEDGRIFCDPARFHEVRGEANSSPDVRSTAPRAWRYACDC